jgi:hypothetical protein
MCSRRSELSSKRFLSSVYSDMYPVENSPVKSIGSQWTTWRHIPDGRAPHKHLCENLKPCMNTSAEDVTILSLIYGKEKAVCCNRRSKFLLDFCYHLSILYEGYVDPPSICIMSKITERMMKCCIEAYVKIIWWFNCCSYL